MTAIPITSLGGVVLQLLSCAVCGRHDWQQDGASLDRDGLLGVVGTGMVRGSRPLVPHQAAPDCSEILAPDTVATPQRLAG